jgi:uncharacterized protein (DUF305 family)
MNELRAKQGKEFEKEFMTQIMNNNQDAITMASLAPKKADRNEIITFAESTRDTKIENINKLKKWYSEWGILAENQRSNPDIH